MEIKQTELVKVEKTGGQTRWVTITALFLTIGVILRLVSPSIAGITPNWLIAMYCLAILVVRPNFKQALGIGLVAGIVCVATSKAAFPWANLASEPIGALVCAAVAGLPVRSSKAKIFLPGLSTLLGTLASGLVFITLTKIVVNVPMQVYLYGMMPVVFTVGAVNSVLTQALYFPAVKLFAGKDAVSAKEE